jgi:chromosome partitioning protein
MGIIYSIVNQKGGVGKTTTAINLGSYLSLLNMKVLLIDMDPQGNATSGVGIDPGKIDKNVYDIIINDEKITNVIYPTPFENLHLIPSTQDLSGSEVELVNYDKREFRLKSFIEQIQDLYDYFIIDCPPSLGLLTLNSLVASEKTLIPVQCEYFALEGLSHLLNTLDLVKNSFNPLLNISGIVLTMYDKRTLLNRQVVDEAKTHFGDKVFDTIIPRSIRLTEAPSHGLPIALYNPRSNGAKAYHRLAKEVLSFDNI